MVVSWNRGTPKSSVLREFSMKSTSQLLRYPHLWKPVFNPWIFYQPINRSTPSRSCWRRSRAPGPRYIKACATCDVRFPKFRQKSGPFSFFWKVASWNTSRQVPNLKSLATKKRKELIWWTVMLHGKWWSTMESLDEFLSNYEFS